MGIQGLPRSNLPADLAAMEERLKRFDAEREATNQWLKSNFPDIGELLKPGCKPSSIAPEAGKQPTGHVEKDVYEGVAPGQQHTGPHKGSEGEGKLPAVGRPHGKGKSFAEAVEEFHAKNDQPTANMLAAAFAENDLVDYMRDSAAKAKAQNFERKFLDSEQYLQQDRDNERQTNERRLQEEQLRRNDDLERQRRDDDLRRDRESADRLRREQEDADRRRRDLDAQNQRRDQEYRDYLRRIEEERNRDR